MTRPASTCPPNPILVTGVNFGCGSSREHAPWALEDYGFKVIIAKSFADIFRGNAPKTGLLPVELAEDEVDFVAAQDEAVVDLESQEVRAGGKTFSFAFDAEIKRRLLNGLDDIGVTLDSEDTISAYEAERERQGPDTLPVRMTTRDWDGAAYDRISAPQEEWATVTLDRLELEGDETVLDAGCGSGRVTRLLLDRLPRGHVLAVDAAPSMVEQARREPGRPRHRVALGPARPRGPRARRRRVLQRRLPLGARSRGAVRATARRAPARTGRWWPSAAATATSSASTPARARWPPKSPTREHLGGWEGPWNFATAEDTADRLGAAGFSDVQTWLEESPMVPAGARDLPARGVPRPPPRGVARGAARALHARRARPLRRSGRAGLRAPQHPGARLMVRFHPPGG